MKLCEILNTITSVTWSKNGDIFYCRFSVEGQIYKLTARNDKFEGLPALEIFFTTDKDDSMSLTNLGKNQFVIFSTVANAISEKFKDDVIWFSAKATTGSVEGRSSLYSKLGQKIAKKLNYKFSAGPIGDDHVFILYRDKPEVANKIKSLGLKPEE